MTAPRYFALVPAAGIGARMASASPKQYLPLAGKPMLRHVLETFAASESIAHTFVVVSASDGYIHALMKEGGDLAARVTVLFSGGATRQQTVLNGLNEMREKVGDDDWILVHDAARPGLTLQLIDALIDALRNDEVGGLLALPVVDTLKRADAGGRAQATVVREGLWAAQTPQMFRYNLLRSALERIESCTDEASAIEALGLRPALVIGSPRNFKVTLPQDIALAEIYLKGFS
ncbi:MAG TPA: 2-C-methyl-D-erythritol 4-phosphate cytidylyltransferase [Noviherbaspirillum sp.]|jgi:2-C-methyl-D-erythritol 4-phosphate cytidylyltransferase|uniref:2-C-methyl-D-erythritol 4-phosphate cytidylyltransferase n=1 Tax=Noviherbaspirillum sp. TaxID=1926288 RepID=UPI002DDC9DBD|nr:2-C-methyl-D-erythritol 4-phosphate cytidylyltransferase [Noviherbaspirillum sp.]HEV2608829.1 2-C-methyl-D-erythritol 4-phosphate cytidylyltransferase [Noviherbaspirillum sp.]